VKYANERKQFGVLISTFGAIKFKLAEQVIRSFALESAIYRVSKDIDDLITQKKATGIDHGIASIESISHYAVEAAILKVYGSEVLDYVADEAVQIHGGMGYSAEMNVERGYRDSRINRIFEGTNEINRLLIVDTAIKKARKNEFNLFGEAEKVITDFDNAVIQKVAGETYYQEKMRYIRNFKKACLILIHTVSKHFDRKLTQEQEILNNLSDMIMNTYVAESVVLRVEKIENLKLKPSIELYRDIADVNVYDAAALIRKFALDALYSFASPEESGKYLKAVNALTTVEGVNVKEARRRIAGKLIEDNVYRF
jgi:alkylation response protein AidB-like acyl-CoA dehydrogenase